ncbi:hypothetical protein HII31_04839 [Pseudocercospora fuligena]|uniref:Uncharacterized protein n=1 Tax=Pseudocercospora fuligena TaxID=685502 RepID=A0A8H6RL04_9PEZI|nr:hypothetical protein HII31_04839 [Pseudocercospora fuligena]
MRFSVGTILALSATVIALPIYEDPSPLETIETLPQSLTQAKTLSERDITPEPLTEILELKNGLPVGFRKRDEPEIVEELLEAKNLLPVGVKRDEPEIVEELLEAKNLLPVGVKRDEPEIVEELLEAKNLLPVGVKQRDENIVTDLLDGKKHAAWKREPGCPTASGKCLWKKETSLMARFNAWKGEKLSKRIVPGDVGSIISDSESTSKFHDMTS